MADLAQRVLLTMATIWAVAMGVALVVSGIERITRRGDRK